MMRIITGKARGFHLATLPGEDTTRPTTERVKESVFSTLQFDIEGRAVLDLFAGSGQMGLEAMSRGAASCVFVDESRAACDVVNANARGAKLTDNVRVLNTKAETFLKSCRERFDTVFLDPPYRLGCLNDILPMLPRLMNDGGLAVCETDAQTDLPERVENDGAALVLEKQRRYGKTLIWIYRCVADGKDAAL